MGYLTIKQFLPMYYQLFIYNRMTGKQAQYSCDNWQEVDEYVQRYKPKFFRIECFDSSGLIGISYKAHHRDTDTYRTFKLISHQTKDNGAYIPLKQPKAHYYTYRPIKERHLRKPVGLVVGNHLGVFKVVDTTLKSVYTMIGRRRVKLVLTHLVIRSMNPVTKILTGGTQVIPMTDAMKYFSILEIEEKPVQPYFEYLGQYFQPLRPFLHEEGDLNTLTPFLTSTGIHNYQGRKNTISNKWEYNKFYQLAQAKGIDDFDIYLMNGKTVVIPCGNELFEYTKPNL